MDAAFGDEDGLVAEAGRGEEAFGQALGGGEIDFEGLQIPVVHADEPGRDFQRAAELLLVVHFHEHGKAGLAGEGMETFELFIGQNGDDEEDGVRAPFDGFENLAFVDDEILAEQGQLDGGADLAEIIERALEELLVREDGEAARAGGLVFARDADGVEIRADDAGGGRGFLHFGDQADTAGARSLERGEEVAAFAVLEHGVAQIPRRDDPRVEPRDLEVFLHHNGIENVHSSSSFTPCMRFMGPPARSQPFTNGSSSPSITP